MNSIKQSGCVRVGRTSNGGQSRVGRRVGGLLIKRGRMPEWHVDSVDCEISGGRPWCRRSTGLISGGDDLAGMSAVARNELCCSTAQPRYPRGDVASGRRAMSRWMCWVLFHFYFYTTHPPRDAASLGTATAEEHRSAALAAESATTTGMSAVFLFLHSLYL